MAELRLITPEELVERSKPKRQRKREERERIIEQFRAQLVQAGPGYGGEVQLGEDDDKRKIRSLLREAAERAGLNVHFRPIKNRRRIEFLIIEKQDQRRTRRSAPRGGRRRAAA